VIKTGFIGEYRWAQFSEEEPELFVPHVVRGLSEFVIGLRAVNVAWDSGRLHLSQEQTAAGWTMHSGYAVTPVIDLGLVQTWPRSSCGFDEWYFFKDLPPSFELKAFCNWVQTSLEDWKDLIECKPDNIDLLGQLQTASPELVVGESYSIFIIARHPSAVDSFLSLAQAP
jgi:hypothetical protein